MEPPRAATTNGIGARTLMRKVFQPSPDSTASDSPRLGSKVLLWTLWRSGTHWLAHMLADLTGARGIYEAADGVDLEQETADQLQACETGSILVRHICLLPEELFRYTEPQGFKIIFLYRDPRDVVASNINMRKYREGYRPGAPPFPDMDLDEILEWEIENLAHWYVRYLPPWVEADHGSLLKVCYEDLVADTRGVLSTIARFLELPANQRRIEEIAHKHSFARQTGRAPGQEDKAAHARKGIIGDFRNQFAPDVQDRLNRLLREPLLRMGYQL